MPYRFGLLCWPAVVLLLTSGCEPKCREVKPISEVQSELRDRIEDDLDEIDATDAQQAKVQKAFEVNAGAVERVRQATFPLQHELVAELKRDPPDRARLGALIDRHLAASTHYIVELVDMLLAGHAALDSAQRKAMAERYSRPSPPLESSFLLDRAIDLFLMRIDATDEQRALVERIKRNLMARGRLLQQKGDALRLEAAAEFAKDKPDRARILAVVERGRGLFRTLFFDLTGYYLLLQSKLEPRQRVMLNSELVRFEPCPAAGPAKSEKASLAVTP